MIPAAIWLRVSTDEQDAKNQLTAVTRFCAAHNLEIVKTYEILDSAWNGGKDGGLYQRALRQAQDDAWRGEFGAIVVWALDRITRAGAEDTLRLVRTFDERGATMLSVEEFWLNTTSEVKDVLVAFAGWSAQQESKRKSQRVKLAIVKRRAAGLPVERPTGARDKKTRSKIGYHQQWAPGGSAAWPPDGLRSSYRREQRLPPTSVITRTLGGSQRLSLYWGRKRHYGMAISAAELPIEWLGPHD